MLFAAERLCYCLIFRDGIGYINEEGSSFLKSIKALSHSRRLLIGVALLAATAIGYIIVLTSPSPSQSVDIVLGQALAIMGTYAFAIYIIANVVIEEFVVKRSRRRENRILPIVTIFSIAVAIALLIPFGAGILTSSIIVVAVGLAFHFFGYDRRWALATAVSVVVVFSAYTASFAYTTNTTGALLQQTQLEMTITSIITFEAPRNENETWVEYNLTFYNPSSDSMVDFQIADVNFLIDGMLLERGSYGWAIWASEIRVDPRSNTTIDINKVYLDLDYTKVVGGDFASMWRQITSGNFTMSISVTIVSTIGGLPYPLSAIFPPVVVTKTISATTS